MKNIIEAILGFIILILILSELTPMLKDNIFFNGSTINLLFIIIGGAIALAIAKIFKIIK